MGEGVHTPTDWQTREVEFDRKNWSALLPKGGKVTAITPQFSGDVVAIVWGRDDAQEAANAALIVRSVNAHEALMKALITARAWFSENGHVAAELDAALKLGRGEQ